MSFLNPFIEHEIKTKGMEKPTIPTILHPTYAQANEDTILYSIIFAYQTQYRMNRLTFIDIGANHPVNTSPSYMFEKIGAQCVLVEANPRLIPELKKHRKAFVWNYAVTTKNEPYVDFYLSPDNEISSVNKDFVKAWKDGTITETIKVPTIKINEVLAGQEGHIVLSIDVEGHDYEILSDIDFDLHKPFIIMVEPSEEFAPGTVKKMNDLLLNKGYELVARTFVNLIYKRKT